MNKLFCKHKRIEIIDIYDKFYPEFISTTKDIRVKCKCLGCGKMFEKQIEYKDIDKILPRKNFVGAWEKIIND